MLWIFELQKERTLNAFSLNLLNNFILKGSIETYILLIYFFYLTKLLEKTHQNAKETNY